MATCVEERATTQWKEEIAEALVLMDEGEHRQAMLLLEDILQAPAATLAEFRCSLLYQLGICYLEQQLYDKAIETLRKVLNETTSPTFTDLVLISDTHRALAHAYEEKGMQSKNVLHQIRKVNL